MSRSVWDLRKLQKSLENKAPSSLYLIYGDESYMVGEALSLLKKKAQLGESGDFGFDQFYYPENLAAQVRDAVETLTILSPRRFVIYKIGNGLKEKEWETLFPVLENPVPSSVFVIVAEKVDKRKKYFRLIGEAGTLVELKRPYENQVSSWIDYMAFTHGIELNSGAAGLLQQLVGSNLSEISNEILTIIQQVG